MGAEKAVTALLGMFLIVVGMVVFVLALPSMVTATDTSTDSPLENQSSTFKSIVGNFGLLFTIVPVLLILAGIKILYSIGG